MHRYRRSLLTLLVALLVLPATAQPAADTSDTPRFRVYTAEGLPAALYDVVMAMDSADVVFVGEQHNDPVAHELQQSLLMQAFDTYSEERPVTLALEMFETDVQPVLDEYLAGLIQERHFLDAARPWNNYAGDYRPLIEFAREHGLPVIAANAPRRYVNRVSRLGSDALAVLPATAQAHLPPLPYPPASDAYRAKWMALMTGFGTPEPETPEPDETPDLPPGHPPIPEDAPAIGPDHGKASAMDEDKAAEPAASPHGSPHGSSMPDFSNLLGAQALWDATMGYRLAQHLDAQPDALVLHMVGAFHVEGGLGTPEALQHYRPGTRALVVVVRPADDPTAFDPELAGAGDFVILTDASLPRSFESPSFQD